MTTFDICLAAFALALAAWSAIAGFALADRLLHDRLVARLILSAVRQARPRVAAVSSLGRSAGVRTLFRRGAMIRLLLDPDQPDWFRNHVADQLSAAIGLRRLVRDAWGRGWIRSRWRRIGAWHILRRTTAVDLHPVLQHAVAGSDPMLAAAAVAVLGTLRDRRAAEILVQALREGRCPHPILMQLEAFDARTSATVLLPLLDEGPALRAWAIMLLSRQPIDGIAQRLERFAADPDGRVRKALAQAMGEIGNPLALATLGALLGDREAYVRAQAVRSLHLISHRDSCPVIALVAPLRSDHDWWVRLAVREVDAGLAPRTAQGRPRLQGAAVAQGLRCQLKGEG